MTTPGCEQIAWADLADYSAGELPESDASALEQHLFSCPACGARAGELDTIARAIGAAARSAEVGGFVTDALLNRLARDGVRIRTFTLSPGSVVPCAVWEGDELMALRLRGDFDGAGELTLSQRVGGREVNRTTGGAAGTASGEIVYATPARSVRDLPAVEVDLRLTASEGGRERTVGSYTLVHGGSLHR